MRRTWGVGIVLLLLLVFAPDSVFAQASSGRRPEVKLKGNYPNPFNPTTTIPFPLADAWFEDGGQVKVTIGIYNMLSQLVAYPTALNHPAGNNVPINSLQYFSPGEFEAFWDGTDKTGRKVASGVYYWQLVVNGVKYPPKKMIVSK